MAKRQLSEAAEVPFVMREAYPADGRSHLDFKLERTWVEARWQARLARAVTTIDHALHRAGWRADTVDRVALIGGSALVPMFQRIVAGVFPARSVTLAPRADVARRGRNGLLTARFGAERRAVPVLDVAG
jgi:molecular chaperone DnaK (HSP70)